MELAECEIIARSFRVLSLGILISSAPGEFFIKSRGGAPRAITPRSDVPSLLSPICSVNNPPRSYSGPFFLFLLSFQFLFTFHPPSPFFPLLNISRSSRSPYYVRFPFAAITSAHKSQIDRAIAGRLLTTCFNFTCSTGDINAFSGKLRIP